MKADERALMKDRARTTLFGVALFGAVQGLGAYLAQNHSGAIVGQLIAAELGTGRLGVTWSDPLAPIPTTTMVLKRALRGAAYGAAAAVVLVGSVVVTRAAVVAAGSFSLASVIVGLVMSACIAARDELLLRGLVLRILGPRAHVVVRLLTCGLAAAAFRFGSQPGVEWTSLAVSGFTGAALGALWLRDRGAWLAVGANAAFGFVATTLAQGTLIDVRSISSAPLDAHVIAVVCGVIFAASAAALVMYPRRDNG